MTYQYFPSPQPGVVDSIRNELKIFVSVSAGLPHDDASRMLIQTAEYLTAWTEAAAVIDENALRNEQYMPGVSRYGCMGASITAADNLMRSMHYVDSVSTRNPETLRRIAQSCERDTARAAHDVQHRAGLDTAQRLDSTHRFEPGKWRLWQDSITDHRTERSLPAPAPECIDEAMRAWERAFCTVDGKADAWAGVPTAIRAAHAYAGLYSIRPFPDGNGRCARTIARGILREDFYSASGLHAVAARHRPPLNARLFDALESGDLTEWSRTFVTLATEGVSIVQESLPDLYEGCVTLAANLDRDALPDPGDRHRIALSLMHYPVDRPKVFAQRHKLDKETTTTCLRPLVDQGHLVLGRINGQQVFINKLSLEIARAMSRPRPRAQFRFLN